MRNCVAVSLGVFGSFPGLLGRGLIEVTTASVFMAENLTLSPVYWAGASLKLSRTGGDHASATTFPGLLGRGLIEVTFLGSWSFSGPRSFPGLLGRGLIEVEWTR